MGFIAAPVEFIVLDSQQLEGTNVSTAANARAHWRSLCLMRVLCYSAQCYMHAVRTGLSRQLLRFVSLNCPQLYTDFSWLLSAAR
eukprot:2340-Heterococcus_DN1.PRE.2